MTRCLFSLTAGTLLTLSVGNIGFAQTPTQVNGPKAHVEVAIVRDAAGSQRCTLSAVPNLSPELGVNAARVQAATTFPGPSADPARATYTVQDLGTLADPASTGRFKISLSVAARCSKGFRAVGNLNVPVYSNILLSKDVVLADGETTQFTITPDADSDETFIVSITLRR